MQINIISFGVLLRFLGYFSKYFELIFKHCGLNKHFEWSTTFWSTNKSLKKGRLPKGILLSWPNAFQGDTRVGLVVDKKAPLPSHASTPIFWPTETSQKDKRLEVTAFMKVLMACHDIYSLSATYMN